MLIHRVLMGPTDGGLEEEWYALVDAELDGKMYEVFLEFESKEDAYEVANHFKTSIEPLEIEGLNINRAAAVQQSKGGPNDV